jgi:hypothetical protein
MLIPEFRNRAVACSWPLLCLSVTTLLGQPAAPSSPDAPGRPPSDQPAGETPPARPRASGGTPDDAMRFRPAYPVPYGPTSVQDIQSILERVLGYLEVASPVAVRGGQFRVISYEWGVTYSGMLHAAEVTSDPRYRDFVVKRLELIATEAPKQRDQVRPTHKKCAIPSAPSCRRARSTIRARCAPP